MKALEGATLVCFFFMMNHTARAASIPTPASPPTIPPAMAPALEPPPWLEVFVGVRLVPVLLEPVEVVRVDTGGFTPVDSGWATTALAAAESHVPATVTLRYAQCGMAVSVGISNGY